MQHQGYQIEAIPRARATIVDALAVGARRHMVHGFVEVDVTRARQIIRRHEHDTGEALSFTAFVIAAAARAIAANKHLNAYRDWRNRLVVFDDVDVATLVEGEAGAVAVPHVIRAANRKSFREIHDEIRAVQARPASSPQRSGFAMRLSGRRSPLLAPALPARAAQVSVVAQAGCRHDRRDRRRHVRGQGRRLGGGHRPPAHPRSHARRNRRALRHRIRPGRDTGAPRPDRQRGSRRRRRRPGGPIHSPAA